MSQFDLIADYLPDITVGGFAGHDLPPETVEGYDPVIHNVCYRAAGMQQIDKLHTELETALSDADFEFSRYAGTRFRYTEEQLREIVQHMLNRLEHYQPRR